ncbi:FecR family protein [Pedobacter helvus]|uniref:FecR family protein n=1 Tax=Pedobacter helvus TaxID=2563444 RepID=A0ABW9JJS6_9SPHI|nr:FecR family protein [Pedobacter ureilyticus]
MDKKIFLEILNKYNQGKASEQEIEMLHAYYDLFDAEQNVLEQMAANQRDDVKQQIAASIAAQMHLTPVKKPTFSLNIKWLAAAAVLVLVFSVGILLFNNEETKQNLDERQAAAVVIKPGSNQAILTLADGSTIGLNEKGNGVIVQRAGLKVIKSLDGQVQYESDGEAAPSINTIATPRGGQYQLVLEDGTKVWLNAASSIKFPTHFAGSQRAVDITGEVYFEVAKNKKMPFIVRTQNQQIEVLGTHFNVNSYTDEAKETTTLLEGSVKVAKLKNGAVQVGASKIISPGQEASLTSVDKAISVNPADLEAAVSWKNGYFKFDKADIQTVMRQISRWYNVDVKYNGEISADLFVGKIKRTEDIAGVLRILELSKINTSVKGRTIVITN